MMNKNLDSSSQGSSTAWQTDMLIRYRENKDEVELTARESKSFLEALSRNYLEQQNTLQRDITILSNAVREQKRLIEYKDLYVSYLSGLMDEEELEKESSVPHHISNCCWGTLAFLHYDR